MWISDGGDSETILSLYIEDEAAAAVAIVSVFAVASKGIVVIELVW